MERIGHYKIVSELGRGGMGVVYKAHEESLNRFVAIKMLGEHLEEDAEYVERFVREAQSAAALSHPNIVQIYAIDEEDGHHYFAMEYVHGTSVQRMIQSKGKLEPVVAARLILQAAAGLQDAHAHGVIHRDIKPANLMVTDRGLVKIADFGLALMGGAASRLTATGMLMGTPGYLSPEQCLDQNADHRTDIYSLGVTFFEMVTGTMPFRADSPLALLKLIVEVEPPDIRELNPAVDQDLRSIIARMLDKDRENRFPNCTDLMTDLTAWFEAKGESIHTLTDAGSAGAAAGVMPPPPPKASAEDINTQPTVAVASGAAETSLPPPPGGSTHDAETAQAPRATAPTTQPGPAPRRRNTGLIVAAVLIFAIAGTAVAAFLTVRSGVLDPILNRGKSGVAMVEEPTEEQVDQPHEPGTSTQTLVQPEAGESTASDAIQVAEQGTAGESSNGEEIPVEVTGGSARATASDTSSQAGGSAGGPSGSDRLAEPQSAATTMPPSQIAVAPPTATVVLAVGERLLAVEAETYIKERLEHAGVEVLDVTAIPGFEGFVNTEARPGPEQVRVALRPFARFMIPVRVDYLGERAIFYMGQRSTAYQARVSMSLVDLGTGRQVVKPSTIKLEYTDINADRVVTEKLRRPTTNLVQRLPRD